MLRVAGIPLALRAAPPPLADPPRPPAAECCIFHKQRPFGEWSDDEDSDSECGECKENQEEQPPS
jgi:hypothetical protein